MVARSRLLSRILVADIGGTNARFAVANAETLELTRLGQMLCFDHATIETAIGEFLAKLADKPRCAALAVAAPVWGDHVQLTNSHWSFRTSELRLALGLDELLVVNDFEALALALPTLTLSELHQIGGIAPLEQATKVALGPGTGLGVGGLVWYSGRWIPVAGEGGHMSLAAFGEHELAVVSQFREGRGHVSAEQPISGPGLRELYRFLLSAGGPDASNSDEVDVVGRALGGEDQIAEDALRLFTVWLGRFAGDIALAFGARGGVYIGGGIAPKITAELSKGPFRDAFDQHGRMSGYLASIPVYVILSEFATLRGVAVAAREKLDVSQPT